MKTEHLYDEALDDDESPLDAVAVAVYTLYTHPIAPHPASRLLQDAQAHMSQIKKGEAAYKDEYLEFVVPFTRYELLVCPTHIAKSNDHFVITFR